MLNPLPIGPLSAEPLVSVLVANYNYARYLPEAIESVLGQSYAALEVIVCDDGSTDESVAVARSFAARDARVRVLTKSNGGVASALNAAFRESRGELVCLLDADDAFLPGKVELIVVLARARPAAGLLVHGMRVVDAAGRELRRIDPSGPASDGWIAADIVRRGGRWRSAPASGMTLRREVAAQLFPLPEPDLRSVADGYLLMLAPLLAEVASTPDVLAIYRLHGGNLTGSLSFSAEQSARHLEGLARIHRLANAWLAEHRPGSAPLLREAHINAVEHLRWRALLVDGAEVMPLWRFARALWRDDLYGPRRKLAGLIAGAGGVVIPRRWRASWLQCILGDRRHRGRVRP
ncbi:MAG: glycosyltransferase [Rhodothermales bacterium]|nr:glycosyltransferase [Rhodothermales bacterium]